MARVYHQVPVRVSSLSCVGCGVSESLSHAKLRVRVFIGPFLYRVGVRISVLLNRTVLGHPSPSVHVFPGALHNDALVNLLGDGLFKWVVQPHLPTPVGASSLSTSLELSSSHHHPIICLVLAVDPGMHHHFGCCLPSLGNLTHPVTTPIASSLYAAFNKSPALVKKSSIRTGLFVL